MSDPIENICMTCYPNIKSKEWVRLSHWYCEKHIKEAQDKYNAQVQELLSLLNKKV